MKRSVLWTATAPGRHSSILFGRYESKKRAGSSLLLPRPRTAWSPQPPSRNAKALPRGVFLFRIADTRDHPRPIAEEKRQPVRLLCTRNSQNPGPAPHKRTATCRQRMPGAGPFYTRQGGAVGMIAAVDDSEILISGLPHTILAAILVADAERVERALQGLKLEFGLSAQDEVKWNGMSL